MMRPCFRIASLLVPAVSLLILFSGCAAEKRTVGPYPDREAIPSAPREKTRALSPSPTTGQQAAPAGKTVPFPPSGSGGNREKVPTEALLPLLTLVDDRIVAYEERNREWEEFVAEAEAALPDEELRTRINECRERLTAILEQYNMLHELLIEASGQEGREEMAVSSFVAAEREDLAFLESGCREIVTGEQQGKGWVAQTRERLLAEKERELLDHMASGEYEQVVALYEALPLEAGEKPSYDATYAYGQALLRSGRERESIEVFRLLLSDIRAKNRLESEFKLMQLIADLRFGLQEYDHAFEKYTDIINRYAGLSENIEWARKQQSVISVRSVRGIEVGNYSELIRRYLAYNPDRDGYEVFLLARRFLDDFPDSEVVPTVNHILFESRDRADTWFAMVLQRVSTMKGEKQYRETLDYLERLPRSMPEEKRAVLDALTDELVTASFEEEEARRRAQEAALQETWNKGLTHLRNREYDQAIEIFSTLLSTDYGERAGDKITEASELAAQEKRRKAAELFVQAGRAADQATRVQLLLESRRLLKDIPDKYPNSGLVEKVRRNLEKIEEEIRLIDPGLLVEDAEKQSVPGGRTTVNGVPIGRWREPSSPEISR
ncbi:MAG: hypothetical protein Kow0089_10340 [Desulfobulbaceae bacterium]